MKPEGLDQEDEGSELLLSGPWSARIRDSRSRKMIDLEDSEEFRLGTETLLSTISDPFIRSSPFDPVFYYRRDLTKWTVYEELDTRTDSPIRQAQIARWQDKLSTDGENLASFLHTSYEEQPEFKEEIDLAMRAAFGEAFDRLVFPPAFEQRIQLGIRWKGLKRVQPAADLSDGTLRFLYLLAILANPDPPPLIAIEEPEVGLHPSMFGIIAEYAAEVSKRTQVVISTHSPDFLDAFGDHEVTTTVFHWHKGETLLGVLQGDELAEWLKHYRLGEYFRSGEFDLWLTEQLSNENDHAGAPESLA